MTLTKTSALTRPIASALSLALLTFLILLQELALIRWLPGQVRVLAYFPNLVLIGAFLGLGVGCLRAERNSLAWLWPTSLLAVMAGAYAMGGIAFTATAPSEHLWLLYYDLPPGAPVVEGVRTPILIAFVLSVASFVAPGQMLARRLDAYRAKGTPLTGYALDLGGSLLGVCAFAALSLLETPPVVWFGLLLIGMVVLCVGHWRRAAGYGLAGLASIAMVYTAERAEIYSPYYAISVVQKTSDWFGFPMVLTNGSLHQVPIDVARGNDPRHPGHARSRDGFHIPYRLLRERPSRALVLGAGTGNDVATMLDHGVPSIDAVEIDPVILGIGMKRHPNRPYESKAVRAINTDARSFLNTTENRYDLIVFGTLDSMTKLSALSNVRLDNFVYTVESIRAAYQRLTDRGGLVLHFMVSKPYILEHLLAMVAQATGEAPRFTHYDNGLFNYVIFAGPAYDHLHEADGKPSAEQVEAQYGDQIAPTDDWPFLYLKQRGVTAFYLSIMAAIAVIAAVAVLAASPALRRDIRRGGRIDVEMMLYGFAFLLLETKSVTTMSLLWGVTWVTSAVVFGAILATMLLATIMTAVRPPPWPVPSTGLVVALVAVYFVPVEAMLDTSIGLKLAFSIAFVGIPIGLASICFALRYRVRADAGAAFGWNLLGAVLGGLGEFLSMALGLKALFGIALAAYLGAFLTRVREARLSGGP